MMAEYFILDGQIPVKCDMYKWATWNNGPNRDVKKTNIGDIKISTVFLGLDHNWGQGPPLLFETMVFGGKLDQEQERYTTWEEAETGHRLMVEKVKDETKTN